MKSDLLIYLIIINLVGFSTIPFYYGDQILITNPLLWLFVPDCQLSALFFAIALILIITNKEVNWLTHLAIASGIKYGFWTLLVMIPNFFYYTSFANPIDYWFIIISHVVLMIQPLIIIKKFNLSQTSITAFIFLIANDASDYLLGTHPPAPDYYLPFLSIATPLITISLILISYYIRKNPLRK